jgi:hypothetical protein
MDKKIKLFNEFLLKNASVNSRRHFLKNCTLGMGGIALSNFLSACNSENNLLKDTSSLNPLAAASPPNLGKVKSVIYLHMVGAPSQLELFDYKPELHKLHNKPCPESLLKGKKFAFIEGVPKMLGPQAEFNIWRFRKLGFKQFTLFPKNN